MGFYVLSILKSYLEYVQRKPIITFYAFNHFSLYIIYENNNTCNSNESANEISQNTVRVRKINRICFFYWDFHNLYSSGDCVGYKWWAMKKSNATERGNLRKALSNTIFFVLSHSPSSRVYMYIFFHFPSEINQNKRMRMRISLHTCMRIHTHTQTI